MKNKVIMPSGLHIFTFSVGFLDYFTYYIVDRFSEDSFTNKTNKDKDLL